MKSRALLIAVAGIGMGMALLYQLERDRRAVSEVEREIATLRDECGLEPTAAVRLDESPELREARTELARLLTWIGQESPHDRLLERPLAACVPSTPDDASRQDLGHRLEAYQPFFDGVDALPQELWDARCVLPGDVPERTTLPRIRDLSWATNALCARAWLAAQTPGGAELAGGSLARALAIARATDDGLGTSLFLRDHVERTVLEALELVRTVAPADGLAIGGRVKDELDLALGEDRLARTYRSEAQRFLDQVSSARESSGCGCDLLAWLRRPAELERVTATLERYSEVVRDSRARPPQTTAAGAIIYPRRHGDDELARLIRSMTALDHRRRERLSTALQSI